MKKVAVIIFASVLLALSLIAVNACKKSDPGTPGKNEIFLLYKAFNPTQLTVTVGTTVKFINKDNANHSVTASTSLFDSGKIKSEQSYVYTFNTAGSYNFYCIYHSSNMQEQGMVIVQ